EVFGRFLQLSAHASNWLADWDCTNFTPTPEGKQPAQTSFYRFFFGQACTDYLHYEFYFLRRMLGLSVDHFFLLLKN
ncbi:MAG: hypothetical protein ACK56F_14740, partial [bacterium]